MPKFRTLWSFARAAVATAALALAIGPANFAQAASKQASSKSAASSKSKASASSSKASRASLPTKRAATTSTKRSTRAVSTRTRSSKVSASKRSRRVTSSTRQRAVAQPRLSYGQQIGLRQTDDPLDLRSSVALVIDQDTNETLFSKNPRAVLPIASLTKLMTGLVISEAHQDDDELLTITQDDVDTVKGSSSRLRVGATLPRGELMHLALMSSENRAAHALGRHYPGGLSAFVSAMNAKAQLLGMHDTRYVEPTGLSSMNQSSARDLAKLVAAAYRVPLLRELTTSPGYAVSVGARTLQYHTTNRLVMSPEWDIGLQKTGYISEAGQCLVMQARVAGRRLIMVLLDSTGARIGDAERLRAWLTQSDIQTAALH